MEDRSQEIENPLGPKDRSPFVRGTAPESSPPLIRRGGRRRRPGRSQLKTFLLLTSPILHHSLYFIALATDTVIL